MKEIMHENGHAPSVYAPISAAAFPTRAAILFGLLGFDERHISAVYESGKQKPGHYAPGTRIPIFSDKDFPWDTYTGPVVNMAWHIPKEIEANWRKRGFAGKMIQIIDEADFTESFDDARCGDKTCYRGTYGWARISVQGWPLRCLDCQWPKDLLPRLHFTDTPGPPIRDAGAEALREKNDAALRTLP